MAAAVQTLHVNPSMDLNTAAQQQFNHYVKAEMPESTYAPPTSLPAPHPYPHAEVNDFPPVLTTSATGWSTPTEKSKRPNTKKPSGPRTKKVKTEPTAPTEGAENGASQSQIPDHMPVQKKKRDRFKGTTEEEVMTRVLPDHIREDLDILIVGINPGLTAAYIQHHYAGPGNHFWKCLYLSDMIPEPMNAMQDAQLLNYGIGFTNIVARTTRGSADLSKKEIAEGGEILKTKMLKYLPKIALFNGKGIYEVFSGSKKFYFGLQPDPFPGCPDTVVFVNPSSSARCTQLPRAQDKVVFYEALKRVRDHIRAHGSIEGIDRSTVTFPDFKLVTAPQKVKKEVKDEPTEGNMQAAAAGLPLTQPAMGQDVTTAPQKAPAKPKKTRGRPKKESTASASKSTPTPQPTTDTNVPQGMNPQLTQMANEQLHLQQNHDQMQQQQQQHQQQQHDMNHYMNGNQMHAMQNEQFTNLKQSHPQLDMNNMQHDMSGNIKQEALEGTYHDKDLAAIIQQSINVQQSMFQQQQSMAANMIQHHGMNAGGIHPSFMMPVSNQPGGGAVKQERSDWPGYGVMPPVTSGPATTMAYPQYSCYWNYLPHTNAGAPTFMTNPYNSIPAAPQISRQQALAAAAGLHNTVGVSMAQQQGQQQQQQNMVMTTSATAAVTASAVAPQAQPQVPTYSSPQDPSSPAMSSQSNLTQASLDSLPKADSASTVANWLQNIPNSSQ